MSSDRQGSGQPTILVIEDDLGLLELIREDFSSHGWGFAHCRTGREALAWLDSHEPALVLLDYSLPDMTGSSLLDQVRMPPFIVTTGAGDERIAVEMMKKGALDYLVKDGLFLENLPSVVKRALYHVGTERRLAEAEASLRLAQESLRQAQKMESLGLMAGGIAHDFNNLFQSLQGNLEGAIRRVPGGTARPLLDKALKILAKASSLSQRMLDFTGKGLRQADALDVNVLVLSCLDGRVETDVCFQPGPGLPVIEGDSVQLLQVLSGLLLNAREAQGPGAGPIRLSTLLCRLDQPGVDSGVWIQAPPASAVAVCIQVEDSGSGMSDEVLERAFDPFFTTRTAGRGLGLSAALGILRGHDAGLWLSTTPGQGSTFRIYFAPMTPEPSRSTPGPAPAEASLARGSILLVDDDEDLRETLHEFLHDVLGHPVFQARDGLEAVAVYGREQSSIGLVLMDATMPGMAGAEAFKAILGLNPQAKGILCSGFSEETGIQTAFEGGFVSFLRKPFPLKVLEEAVRQVLWSI